MCVFGEMYATRSPRLTPSRWRAWDHLSQREKKSAYVSRSAPSTTASRSGYSLRVRRANSSGLSGVSISISDLCRSPRCSPVRGDLGRKVYRHTKSFGRVGPTVLRVYEGLECVL